MDNVFIERLWRSLKYECVSFLDPAIVTRIGEGKAPAGIDTKCLTQADAIPIA